MIFNYITRQLNRELEIKQMEKGYQMTESPVPSELVRNHAYKWKIFQNEEGLDKLGFQFAEDGLDLVSSKSLKFISKKLSIEFRNSPKLSKQFEKKLPKNLIAICFAQDNFEVGDACQEFRLSKSSDFSKQIFSHRKFSECLQCTYYHENGTQFLAGICYYPASYIKPTLCSQNGPLLEMILYGAIPYPLQDRRKTRNYIENQTYGRFCHSAQKMVTVYFRWAGMASHYAISYDLDGHFYTEHCEECLKDHYEYKWEEESTPSVTVINTVLDIFQTAGIGAKELSQLKSMPETVTVPMINKTESRTLATEKHPELKNLLLFIMLNPDWTIDMSFFEGISNKPTESLEIFDPETTKFSIWLLAHPEYSVPSETILMTQLMQEISIRKFWQKERSGIFQSCASSLECLNIESDNAI